MTFKHLKPHSFKSAGDSIKHTKVPASFTISAPHFLQENSHTYTAFQKALALFEIVANVTFQCSTTGLPFNTKQVKHVIIDL